MSYLDLINEKFPIRRKDEEKSKFLEFLSKESKKMGFSYVAETTSDGKNKNFVVGDVEGAKVVFTAHYDTPARSIFPNIMIPRNLPLFFSYQFLPVILMLLVSLPISYLVGMVWLQDSRAYMLTFLALYYVLYFLMFRGPSNPKNYNDNTSGVATLLEIMRGLSDEEKDKVAFIFFDNEEKGKKGSKAYFKNHESLMKDKLLINFDCVGNGETVVFIAKEEAEKTEEYERLKGCFAPKDGYTAEFYPMRGSESNSDYKSFPLGIGCMACKRSKRGLLYTPAIHTAKDTVAKEENIEYIKSCALKFIGEIK